MSKEITTHVYNLKAISRQGAGNCVILRPRWARWGGVQWGGRVVELGVGVVLSNSGFIAYSRLRPFLSMDGASWSAYQQVCKLRFPFPCHFPCHVWGTRSIQSLLIHLTHSPGSPFPPFCTIHSAGAGPAARKMQEWSMPLSIVIQTGRQVEKWIFSGQGRKCCDGVYAHIGHVARAWSTASGRRLEVTKF